MNAVTSSPHQIRECSPVAKDSEKAMPLNGLHDESPAPAEIDYNRVITHLKNEALPAAGKKVPAHWKTIALKVAYFSVLALGLVTFIATSVFGLPGWMVVAASVGWVVATIGLSIASSKQAAKEAFWTSNKNRLGTFIKELEKGCASDGKVSPITVPEDEGEIDVGFYDGQLKGIKINVAKYEKDGAYTDDFYQAIFDAYEKYCNCRKIKELKTEYEAACKKEVEVLDADILDRINSLRPGTPSEKN